MRPPRESYVRAVVELEGVEMIAGIEMREGDDFATVKAEAKLCMTLAWIDVDSANRRRPDSLAMSLERLIVDRWPDRYWFLEVYDRERDSTITVEYEKK